MALVFEQSQIGPTTNAHEFINYELELKHSLRPYWRGDCAWWRKYATNNEPIEKVGNVQISDVVEDIARFTNVESALVTLKNKIEQRPTDVTPFIQSIQTKFKKK